LFVDNHQIVSTYVSAKGGSREDADDLLQEAIIVLWQNACKNDFQLTSKPSTYLLAIVKNKFNAMRRKTSRISEGEIPEQYDDDSILPDEKYELDMRNAQIKKALERIGSVCRDLLLLFYFEGFSMQEIAVKMSFSNQNTAKSKKYQCMKKLEQVYLAMNLVNGGGI